MVIVLFGVTGSGKTTIGKLLANDLGWRFIDADDHHSVANIEKMSSGTALNDEDRSEWLGTLRVLLEAAETKNENIVLACSALKTAYRQRLGVSDEVKFVLLDANFGTIQDRLAVRKGHFMAPKLLKSQVDILETESHVDLVIDASQRPDTCLTTIRKSIEVPA